MSDPWQDPERSDPGDHWPERVVRHSWPCVLYWLRVWVAPRAELTAPQS